MDIRNCRGCGKLFNYIGGSQLCPACMRELDKKFDEVKRYIYDNPTADIQQVSLDNEVSVLQLKKWIREERLAFSEKSMVGLECESCGAMIRTGRFCQACKDKMAATLGDAYRTRPEEKKQDRRDNPKMRYLDK